MIEQALILCGGLGTRLGELTRATPKPLLHVAGRPFLEILIGEIVRQGVEEVILLAGFCADQVDEFVKSSSFLRRLRARVTVLSEPEPMGTGGAVYFARDRLADSFLMLNGDSFFDIPIRELAQQLDVNQGAAGALALRRIDNPDRFGLVDLVGDQVRSFAERQPGLETGLINGGVYAFRRDGLLPLIQGKCSLEADILPCLASAGALVGAEYDGYFLDIGIPETFEAAQIDFPRLLKRPAIFFDRDGVLNHNHGHVGTVDRFDWIEGAREAVALANRSGFLVFVVTNQAGVARGLYQEADISALFRHMKIDLAAADGHIDDYRYCPHHPESTLAAYRKTCDWRKPGAGMINDLVDQWGVDVDHSLLIGDSTSDIQAAESAGLPGHLFTSGSLYDFVKGLIA